MSKRSNIQTMKKHNTNLKVSVNNTDSITQPHPSSSNSSHISLFGKLRKNSKPIIITIIGALCSSFIGFIANSISNTISENRKLEYRELCKKNISIIENDFDPVALIPSNDSISLEQIMQLSETLNNRVTREASSLLLELILIKDQYSYYTLAIKYFQIKSLDLCKSWNLDYKNTVDFEKYADVQHYQKLARIFNSENQLLLNVNRDRIEVIGAINLISKMDSILGNKRRT